MQRCFTHGASKHPWMWIARKGREREKQWKQQQQRVARLISRPRVISCTVSHLITLHQVGSPLPRFAAFLFVFQVTFCFCLFGFVCLIAVVQNKIERNRNNLRAIFLVLWFIFVFSDKHHVLSFESRSVVMKQSLLVTLDQFCNAFCYFVTICSWVTKAVWSRAAQRVVCFEFFFSLKTPAAPQPP